MVEVVTDLYNYVPVEFLLSYINQFFKINFLKLVFHLVVLDKCLVKFVLVNVDECDEVFQMKITKVYTCSSVPLKMVLIRCIVVLENEVCVIVRSHWWFCNTVDLVVLNVMNVDLVKFFDT